MILDIIEFGAKIGYQGPAQQILSENLSSATDAPDIISQDLDNQIKHDRVTKIDILPPQFISSPLGLVPKPNGGWRRIHHLSHPRGSSVNCNIPEEFGTLEYTTFDDAVEMLLKVGSGAIFVKRDLADAFRHIPVSASDWWLLGFLWYGYYWFERFLPFGLRTSPFIFDLFAKGIHWILMNGGWENTLHYLDDFFAILSSQIEAQAYEDFFLHLCLILGVHIKDEKSLRATIAEFLGIELDSIKMEARLPPAKLKKAEDWVKKALAQRTITRENLQSLLGFLSFAAKVVIPGRAFLRRLFTALREFKRIYHIDADMRADLKWWAEFLPQWNGIQILRHIESRKVIQLWTDASGLYGIGGFILMDNQKIPPISQAYSQRFSTRLRNKHITVKEMFAVLHALSTWLPLLARSRLIIYGDNTGVVQGLKHSSIVGPAMDPLRKIAMILATHDIVIESNWIPSKENFLADILSRGQWHKLTNEYSHLQILCSANKQG